MFFVSCVGYCVMFVVVWVLFVVCISLYVVCYSLYVALFWVVALLVDDCRRLAVARCVFRVVCWLLLVGFA